MNALLPLTSDVVVTGRAAISTFRNPCRSFQAVAVVGFAACLAGCGAESGRQTSAGSQTAAPPVRVAVEPGDKERAITYYTETLEALGLKPRIETGEPRLSEMLAYLGYPDLTPGELEDTSSERLMTQHGEDLRSSVFFAPKITDVSQGDPAKINPGWRKVIRLRAKSGSAASQHGIGSGFLLFNKFQGIDRTKDPVIPRADRTNESSTTQLILVRASKSANEEVASRPVHFFVYGPVSQNAPLKLALQATFDAAAPEIEAAPSPVRDYFVPQACGQCHGGLKFNAVGDKVVDFPRQKLNSLDSDHWFDRVQTGDDFAFLQTSAFGVLYDGGTVQGAPQFDRAFDVVRLLNREIQSQIERTEAAAERPSFQLRSVTRWLLIHASSSGHQPVFARALEPLTAGAAAWSEGAAPDKELLPALNRYCYRCHSSIVYSIFDRAEVACRKTKIGTFVKLPAGDPKHMPQDRVLDDGTASRLFDLVSQLPGGLACN